MKNYVFYEKSFPLIIAFLERCALPLKPPTVCLDWYLRGALTKLILEKKIDLNKREVFLYSTNNSFFCKNFIFYSLGSEEEIRNNSLSFLLKPLSDVISKLRIKNFYIIPSQNSLNKINELREIFRDYYWDYLD